MKNDFDDDDAEFDDELGEEEYAREYAESVVRDYTGRNILVVEGDESRQRLTLTMLQDLLPGANVRACEDVEEAMVLMVEEEFDTFVVDFQTPGVSNSELVKSINNDPDAFLVAFSMQNLDEEDLKNRFKLEPVRKLFDFEKGAKSKV